MLPSNIDEATQFVSRQKIVFGRGFLSASHLGQWRKGNQKSLTDGEKLERPGSMISRRWAMEKLE